MFQTSGSGKDRRHAPVLSAGRPGRRKRQTAWCEDNPGYFKGRSSYVKERRAVRKAAAKDKTVLQDEIPLARPLMKLVLLVPDGVFGVLQDEITLKRLTKTTFAAHGFG